ncbi:MotA/TolQ/ExbB proton channel family protein [uncultured Rikenella sp.]|uniref:MotA/TolQ/ExbB proton channel family protein n=1 Tax=uncultured Rikenella sp. TaxID=368003 RepID=UPI002618893E|nr:MotA/TolQ/ExbB proton channel family protein [uncultured Rikenella sp.]
MKKLLTIVSMVGLLTFGTVNLYAQEAADSTAAAQTEQTDAITPAEEAVADAVAGEDLGGQPMHQALKQKFIEGGVGWMSPILLCLVLGLAIVIERVIYLNLATVNTKKLLEKVEDALNNGGIEAAKDVCRNTRGPVASIFYQGLDRTSEGIDVVEKSVASYGSVQAGQLESGMSWISLFIALSPMLGFMGTVVGMIAAFDAIEAAGDIAPALVAGGMKIALLTTVAGLIAAVILQLFYNYLVAKIDSIVISMEDASISLVDILTKYLKK